MLTKVYLIKLIYVIYYASVGSGGWGACCFWQWFFCEACFHLLRFSACPEAAKKMRFFRRISALCGKISCNLP